MNYSFVKKIMLGCCFMLIGQQQLQAKYAYTVEGLTKSFSNFVQIIKLRNNLKQLSLWGNRVAVAAGLLGISYFCYCAVQHYVTNNKNNSDPKNESKEENKNEKK